MKCRTTILINFIEEYEEILMGERKEFSQYFFETNVETETIILECIRYACENLLHWTPKQACALFDASIVDLMKLTPLINYIQFPSELEKEKDFYYIMHRLYPRLVPFSVEDSVINMYKRILNGKAQFPRDYATGTEGVTKLCICLQYAIEHFHPFCSVKDMYEFFASTEGIRFLKKYQLFTIMSYLGLDALTLLHETLPDVQRSMFYYTYYNFEKNYTKYTRQLATQKKKAAKMLQKET